MPKIAAGLDSKQWMLLAGALVAGGVLALVLKPIVKPCNCQHGEE